MNSVSLFDRQMVWLFLVLSGLSVVSLGYCIRNVIRLARRSRIISVALQEEQQVEFSEAGRLVMCLEGPMFTRRFAKLGYELSAGDGSIVTGRTALFRSRITGFCTVRMDLKRYEIQRPGLYHLRITGLGEGRRVDAKVAIVFTRPHLAGSIGYMIGIVLSSGIFITSLVFALLCFVSN
jgi:F0F1-type ATP synthase membrane subunit c/vacuolar-type H+-ATPase subunit K